MTEERSIIEVVEERIKQAEIDLTMAALVAEYDYWDQLGRYLRGEIGLQWPD